VEQGPGINHAIAITINRSLSQPGATHPILRFGRTTLLLETVSFQKIRFKLQNPSAPSVLWPPAGTGSLVVLPHRTYDAFLMTDPNLHEIEVFWNGRSITKTGLSGDDSLSRRIRSGRLEDYSGSSRRFDSCLIGGGLE